MYARQPDVNRPKIKIPENYSGHAFRGGNQYGDMPPPTRLDLPPPERSFSSQTEENQPIGNENLTLSPRSDAADEKSNNIAATFEEAHKNEEKPSIFSSLLPTSFASASHFPFGHGIGSEELLIMAIMLAVFLSDSNGGSSDHELLMLLGLLLFSG